MFKANNVHFMRCWFCFASEASFSATTVVVRITFGTHQNQCILWALSVSIDIRRHREPVACVCPSCCSVLPQSLQYFHCWALLALCWHSRLHWRPVFWLAGLGDGQRGLLFYCTPLFHPKISPFFLTSLLICEEWEVCSVPDGPGSHVVSPRVSLPPCEGSCLCRTKILDFYRFDSKRVTHDVLKCLLASWLVCCFTESKFRGF